MKNSFETTARDVGFCIGVYAVLQGITEEYGPIVYKVGALLVAGGWYFQELLAD